MSKKNVVMKSRGQKGGRIHIVFGVLVDLRGLYFVWIQRS